MSKGVAIPILVFALLMAACVPITPEPSASTFEQDTLASGEVAATCCCADGMLSIQPGQSAKELAPDYGTVPGYIDIVEIGSSLEGNILSATFYLRELPEELTFRREGVKPNFSEYSWLVQIDVDGLPEGFHSNDYMLSLNSTYTKTGEDVPPVTAAFARESFALDVMRYEHPADVESISELVVVLERSDTEFIISHDDQSITLTGKVPGITSESFITFVAFDYLYGLDGIECHG